MKPDMSVFDVAQAARRPGQKLRVDEVLAELPADRADALKQALTDMRYAPRTVAHVVTGQWGVPLSDAAVRSWRRRHGLE